MKSVIIGGLIGCVTAQIIMLPLGFSPAARLFALIVSLITIAIWAFGIHQSEKKWPTS